MMIMMITNNNTTTTTNNNDNIPTKIGWLKSFPGNARCA